MTSRTPDGLDCQPKLLLVDDNEQFRLTLRRAFERRGWCVTAVASVDQALARTRVHSPTHAIIDLNLESKSLGLDLIPPLRDVAPGIRIVVLTGYASIATAVRAIQLGATHYLAKPADLTDIIAAFERKGGDAATPVSDSPMSVNQLEWEYLQRTLLAHDGNITATARALNMHRRSLQRKLRKHARW